MDPPQNNNYQPFPTINLSVAQQSQQIEGFQTLISNGQSYVSWQEEAPLLQQCYIGGMSMGSIPPGPLDIMEEDDFQAHGPGMETAYTVY
jgi:hypothetical protein